MEDGAYVGRSNNAKLYGHLVSDHEYQDFTVRFEFQCPSGDSGFFIRTKMKEPDKTLGLQIQVGPLGSGTGGIYESYWPRMAAETVRRIGESGYREGQLERDDHRCTRPARDRARQRHQDGRPE